MTDEVTHLRQQIVDERVLVDVRIRQHREHVTAAFDALEAAIECDLRVETEIVVREHDALGGPGRSGSIDEDRQIVGQQRRDIGLRELRVGRAEHGPACFERLQAVFAGRIQDDGACKLGFRFA